MTLTLRTLHWPEFITALVCLVLAAALAVHYPLGAALALIGVMAAAALAMRFWTRTPALFALMPLLGFAPWSGWITFEEMDLLVLAVAAGGYGALALNRPPQERLPAWRHELAYSAPVLILILLFAATSLLAMQRGFADAGGFQFSWWQGYLEPMNSLRNVKSYFLALILVPLWLRAAKVRPHEQSEALLWAMVAACVGMSLAAVWERQAFTGLLNFSSDYRTTALFWEMHVGGAAFDGALALTMPFVLIALLRQRSPLGFAALMGVAVLGLYACLTTFSRGVYLAIPAGIAVMLWLRGAQWRRASQQKVLEIKPLLSVPGAAKLGALALIACFGLGALHMFPSSGYRGLVALLGSMMILLTMPSSQWLPSRSQRVVGTLMGALLGFLATGVATALAIYLPKAAYVSYALAFFIALIARRLNQPGEVRPVQSCLMSALWFWVLFSTVLVADSWGGNGARADALDVAVPLGLAWLVMLIWPALWPFKALGSIGWRQRGLVFSALIVIGASVGVLGGGVYLRDRMSTVAEDMDVRLHHWRQGISMLDGPQQMLLGKGAGRYVASMFFEGPFRERVGDYRLQEQNGETFLRLSGQNQPTGGGELLRFSQRIAPPEGRLHFQARVRSAKPLALVVEVCEKHLLYPNACLGRAVPIKPQSPEEKGWQKVDLDLGLAQPMGGDRIAPRMIMFSLAVDTVAGIVDVDSVSLADARGDLLSNGSFTNGTARWFFSSDRNHLPWHIKNMALHVWFEQGLLGLFALASLVLLALLRLSFGRGREQPLAPALAGAIIGFLCVGAFDSLLDVPRVGLVFFALLLFSLGLRALPGTVAERA